MDGYEWGFPNATSLPEGIRDLTFHKSRYEAQNPTGYYQFQPILRDRDGEGRWIVRYYFPHKPDQAAFAINRKIIRTLLPFNEAQKAATREALASISHPDDPKKAVNIVFVEVDDPKKADIRYFAAKFNGRFTGYSLPGNTPKDALIADDKPKAFAKGGFAYGTILHETFHLLGLKHPRNRPYDKLLYTQGPEGTIMTYMPDPLCRDSQNNQPGIYDIAALQYLYGEARGSKERIHSPIHGHPSGLPARKSRLSEDLPGNRRPRAIRP